MHYNHPAANCISIYKQEISHIIMSTPSQDVKYSGGAVKYMDCLKNHAAAIGGTASDGCCEFMAGGDEGSLEALKCSACNCHRNFHRKINIQTGNNDHHHHHQTLNQAACVGKSVMGLELGHNEHDHGDEEGSMVVKKRYRTKFTKEQKEKMYWFAEKAGWKMQKVGDSEIKSFCQEIGIKRKVLKVWMHNNKYHLAKKITPSASTS